jgi:hypothetical protein
MKSWKRILLVAIACFLTAIAGAFYTGADSSVIRSLLTCFGILLVTWMEIPASHVDGR